MAKSRLFGLLFAVLISAICASNVFAQTLVFGPKTYTRENGAKNIFTDNFSLSSLQGTFTLIVENGNATRNSQVTNGSVTLNGVEVITQKDFNKGARIEKTITPLANNTLNVQLKGGPPNSLISVSIVRRVEDHDGPVITIEQPQSGQTFNSSPITVSGKVTDISGVAELKVNGTIVPVVNDAFTTQITLIQGSNTITVQAKDSQNNTSQVSIEVFLVVSKILSINPNSGQSGQTLSVTITGENTHFAQGVTQASFGAGISVGGGQAGGFGSVNVLSTTSATAQLEIGASAAAGPRTVTLKTNQEEASLAGGFAVVVTVPPTISDFTPKSGPIGTLVTVTGANFSQGGIGPQVTLNKQGGGTITAPVSSSTPTTLTFVIPAGAATGPLAIGVGSQSATSADALNVVASSTFDLAVVPGSIEVIRGQSGSFALILNSNNGFTQLSALSVSGLPSGVTASFKPQQITAGQGSILTISVSVGQPLGETPLTLSAKATVDGIELTSSIAATLNVKPVTTSFLGRTVVADTLETPLAGVTVTFVGKNSNGNPTNCSSQTVSDAAGNFSFTDLPAGCVGEQLIRYDGLTATAPAGRYAGVDLIYNIVSNQVTASPVLVHLPRIDDKETVMVQQNASEDQTFDFKTVPGLSVTVYAGTKFTLVDGTQPNPFPLAAVQVPVDRLPDAKPPAPGMVMVFIVAFQPANATASQPVAVYFPNTINTRPGTNMVLMTLDPTKGSMVPYGTGTVANDGSNVIPDLDPAHPGKRYGLVHFDWHGQMPPPGPNVNPSPDGPCGPQEGKPVDISSGVEVITQTDIAIKGGRGSISIERTYRSLSTVGGPFGVGTSHNYDYRLDTTQPQNSATLNLIMPDGNRFAFVRQANGTLINSTVPSLRGAVITTAPDATATLRWKDGVVYQFVPGTFLLGSVLQSIIDPNGNTVSLTRNSAQLGEIDEVVDPVGRRLVLTYDGATRITSIVDPIGRSVRYTYNGQGTLETVTDPEGGITRYDYDAQNRLTRVTDARGIVIAQNTYDANGRVIEQVQADGGKLHFDYVLVNPLAPTSPILQTTVTDPLGAKTTYRFNTQGFLSSVTDALGQSKQFDRDPGSNLLLAVKGPASCNVCGNANSGDEFFTYDELGNLLSKSDALGNTIHLTYEPVFNKVASVKDAVGNITSFIYDSHGNLAAQTNAKGKTISYRHNDFGLLVETTDPLNKKTAFTYDSSANLVTTTDALGNKISVRYDGISRPIEIIDRLGRKSKREYDKLNRLRVSTNASNARTEFTYDAVGNWLSISDPRGNNTSFTYDSMSRLISHTAPTGKTNNRKYDFNGNTVEFTDRLGHISTREYDALNRLTKTVFHDGSTVTRFYDSASHLVRVEDSIGGVFSYTYDLLGRLKSSASQFGTVEYSYDEASRTKSRKVVGQPTAEYSYDAVGNLLGVSMPQASVTFSYNDINQRDTATYSNGVVTTYTYDALGQVQSIENVKGSTVLNSQNYSYDATGNRISQQANISQPLITQPKVNEYDTHSDQLLRSGATTYTYDDNGNRLTETNSAGTTQYGWDARNRLQSIATPDGITRSFRYDFAGNLISHRVFGPSIDFTQNFVLDDLTNVIYQTDSLGKQRSVLTGNGIDQHFATVESSEAEVGFNDALNSTVLTTDGAGAIKSEFFYEPFGQTTRTPDGYLFQFSGRLAVTPSLYYYRARYYDSVVGQFISPDPIELFDGLSSYAYVNNSPVNATDPAGLFLLRQFIESLGNIAGGVSTTAVGVAISPSAPSVVGAFASAGLILYGTSSASIGVTQLIGSFTNTEIAGSIPELIVSNSSPETQQAVSDAVTLFDLSLSLFGPGPAISHTFELLGKFSDIITSGSTIYDSYNRIRNALRGSSCPARK